MAALQRHEDSAQGESAQGGAERRAHDAARPCLANDHPLRTAASAILLWGAFACGGCGGEDRGVAPGGSGQAARPAASGPAPTSTPASSSSQSAAATVSSAPPAAPGTCVFAGTWKGSYRAEKVTPTLDPTVTDEVWNDDDGKRHAGTGRIELIVAPDGTTTGTIDGPLAGDVAGSSDEQMVRAAITAAAADGASGTLIGRAAAKGLAIEVRTSDGAGRSPRIAKGILEKAP